MENLWKTIGETKENHGEAIRKTIGNRQKTTGNQIPNHREAKESFWKTAREPKANLRETIGKTTGKSHEVA